MPRLSVDIDVVYTDHQATRDEALKSISSGLDAVRKRLAKLGMGAKVSATKEGDEIKLFIERGRNQVKVEVNHVFRGTVLPVEARRLGDAARRAFYHRVVRAGAGCAGTLRQQTCRRDGSPASA